MTRDAAFVLRDRVLALGGRLRPLCREDGETIWWVTIGRRYDASGPAWALLEDVNALPPLTRWQRLFG